MVIRTASGWDFHSVGLIKDFLGERGHKQPAKVVGAAVADPWKLVSLPLAPEYPGGRQWNCGAAQLRVLPGDREAEHPSWDRILNHAGRSLDAALRELPWAAAAGIASGGDYLRAWIASLIREPFQRLPYLFFHGPEDSGKSIIWEAIKLLLSPGVVEADRVLTNQSGFNGELAGAVLCVVEEVNVAKTPGALSEAQELCHGAVVRPPPNAVRHIQRPKRHSLDSVLERRQFLSRFQR